MARSSMSWRGTTCTLRGMSRIGSKVLVADSAYRPSVTITCSGWVSSVGSAAFAIARPSTRAPATVRRSKTGGTKRRRSVPTPIPSICLFLAAGDGCRWRWMRATAEADRCFSDLETRHRPSSAHGRLRRKLAPAFWQPIKCTAGQPSGSADRRSAKGRVDPRSAAPGSAAPPRVPPI